MKLAKMPLANKIQAIETALDSALQGHGDPRPKITLALRLIRIIQEEFYGPHKVNEKSLRNFSSKYLGPNGQPTFYAKKRHNWRAWQRERAAKQNGSKLHDFTQERQVRS